SAAFQQQVIMFSHQPISQNALTILPALEADSVLKPTRKFHFESSRGWIFDRKFQDRGWKRGIVHVEGNEWRKRFELYDDRRSRGAVLNIADRVFAGERYVSPMSLV